MLQEGVDSGELRLLFVLTDFHGLEPSALPEDAKTGLRAWVRDHSAWKRFALVTRPSAGSPADGFGGLVAQDFQFRHPRVLFCDIGS